MTVWWCVLESNQLVCILASLNDFKSWLNLWTSEWFAAGEFFCGNESSGKGTQVLFEVFPQFRSFSKVHTHIVAVFPLKYLWAFDILASFLSAAQVVVFSLPFSLHASIPFSLDYSFMPLPVFHIFLSMNINAPFDCQHLPFQIQLLASTQGAMLNALVGYCCDMFSVYQAKSALNAKLAEGLFGTLINRCLLFGPQNHGSKCENCFPKGQLCYQQGIKTCCALILLKLTKPTCCLNKTFSGVSSEL